MIRLCIDTSHPIGSLTISRPELSKKTVERRWSKPASHSETATEELGRLCSELRIKARDITQIAVNHGPGSFTGLRVGINISRTLSYATGCPVVQVSTLDLLAEKYGTGLDSKMLVAVKALREFFYLGIFESDSSGWKLSEPPRSVSQSQLALCREDIVQRWVEGVTPGFQAQTFAEDIERYLVKRNETAHLDSWKNVRPLYIRRSEAEEKLG